jgi:hypothetical protein
LSPGRLPIERVGNDTDSDGRFSVRFGSDASEPIGGPSSGPKPSGSWIELSASRSWRRSKTALKFAHSAECVTAMFEVRKRLSRWAIVRP